MKGYYTYIFGIFILAIFLKTNMILGFPLGRKRIRRIERAMIRLLMIRMDPAVKGATLVGMATSQEIGSPNFRNIMEKGARRGDRWVSINASPAGELL